MLACLLLAVANVLAVGAASMCAVSVDGHLDAADALVDEQHTVSHSEVGGKRVWKDRATAPGGRFISSVRACAQCYSCRIRAKMRVRPPSLFPLCAGAFPFSLQDWSV